MKIIYIFPLLCFLLIGCFGELPEEDIENIAEGKEIKEESTKPIPLEPATVLVISEPPGADSAAFGTGIVVDKENGLILTARHGVYHGDVLNYKNERLFKNIIVTDRGGKKKIPGYVTHLSLNYDLAIIKVDHRFPSEAVFISSDSLKVRDEVEFSGFPDGQYGIYKGSIANIKENYLNLDMNVIEGMSGGPISVHGKGIAGIVLLKQKIGGNALRSELVNEYLADALPQVEKVRMKTYSLRLKKVILNQLNTQHVLENELELHFQFSVNGKKIMETEKIKVSGRELHWGVGDTNKIEITLLPGDKIELKVFESKTLSYYAKKIIPFTKEPFTISEVIEEFPQKGLPNFASEITFDGYSVFFEIDQ